MRETANHSPAADKPAGPAGLSDLLLAKKTSLNRWIWSTAPRDDAKWLRWLQAVLRIALILLREIGRDRITLRASALTFTVVLSLVPVLALGTAVLKGLGAGDQMRQAAYRFIDQLEKPAALNNGQAGPSAKLPITLINQDKPAEINQDKPAEPPPTKKERDKNLSGHLYRAIDQIFDYVDRTNFATLGAFGIIGLLLSVILVLGTIEQSMNVIWQAASGRPFGRKLMDYLALMILLPAAINLALAAEATLSSPALFSRLQSLLPLAWLGALLLNMLPIVAVVATFTILYRFVPNTWVGLFPAFMGGLFGGLGWLLTQTVYFKIQIGVARYNAIYGSFATLPLLLLWIYVGWVFFLAGAEMAFAVQNWRRYLWKDQTADPITRLALAFDIMEIALTDHRHRVLTDKTGLVNRLNQPLSYVNGVVDDLLRAGLLIRTTSEKEEYLPAATEENIKAAEIIDLIMGTEMPSLRGCSLAAEAIAAAKSFLKDKTLTCRPEWAEKDHSVKPS